MFLCFMDGYEIGIFLRKDTQLIPKYQRMTFVEDVQEACTNCTTHTHT